MKNRIMICCLIGVLVFSMCPFTAYAADTKTYQKNENVYARLGADGAAGSAYVVNVFELEDDGQIKDYGDYSEVKNLTDLRDISQTGDEVQFASDAGKFYYQGKVEQVELPWKFSVSYRLDDEKISPEELGGKSGHVKISLSVKENSKTDEIFFENYVMQISVTLDGERFRNITSEKGTLADSGADKAISFTLLPGTEDVCTFEADVNNFVMAGFSMAAVPYSMNINMDGFNTDDLTEQFSELTNATAQLNDAAAQIKDGIRELDQNGDSLLDGYGQIVSGLAALNQNSSGLISASSQISGALTTLSTQLSSADFSSMDSLKTLPDTLNQLSQALIQLCEGLVSLNQGFTASYQALDQVMQSIPEEISQEEIAALQAAVSAENAPEGAAEVLNKLLDAYTVLQSIYGTYQQVQPAFEAVTASLSEEQTESVVTGMHSVIGGIDTMSSALSSSLSSTNISGMMRELTGGIQELAVNYQQFHQGLVSYTGGISSLYQGSVQYQSGLGSYLDGIGQLSSGASEFSNGMRTYTEGISEIPDQMQSQIDEMMEQYNSSDFDAVSFVDSRNEAINSVQFVLTTDSIEEPEVEEEEAEKTQEGFFQRLLKLFF